MRVFASLPVPPGLTDSLRPALPGAPDGVRAVPGERWHLTLAFYGQMDAPGVDCLRRKLQRRVAAWSAMGPHVPLRLRVVGGGAFPGGAVFLAVAQVDAHPALRVGDLARECVRAGRGCDAPGIGNRQHFRAHITVARARRHGAVPLEFVERLQLVRSPAWPAGEVRLMASTLGPKPRYEVLDRVVFAA